MDVINPKELQRAFVRNELVLAYQPIVHLETGHVSSVEALVRWRHTALGLLEPGSFLSLLHDAGLSHELTKYGLTQALQDLPQLRNVFGSHVAVALNLSRSQLREPALATELVCEQLDRFREPATSLRVEVVEDLSVDDFDSASDSLGELRDLGVQVILDDFGTGASSLSMLTDLNYDALKIDQSFTTRMLSSPTTQSVIASVLAFAKATAIDVVVEGVETEEQLRELKSMGCEFVQGYLLGRPAEIRDVTMADAKRATRSGETQPVVEIRPIDELTAAIALLNPRSTVTSFGETVDQLESLDRQAVALGEIAATQRLEIGRNLTLAAIYGGSSELVTKWALHTSRLAEEIDEWGYSAEVLGILASCPGHTSDYAGVRIDALVGSMRLRISKPIGSNQSSRVDNSIGAAFANLGLFSQALAWWSDSAERNRLRRGPGDAMVCLNLADLQVQVLEGERPGIDDMPRAARVAKVYSVLSRLEDNPSAAIDGAASIQARLELSLGNTDEATKALARCSGTSSDILSQVLVLRARALVARDLQRTEDFLTHTTKLIEILEGNLLLSHYARRAQRLHAAALLAAGRTDEGIAVLHAAYQEQMTTDTSKIGLLFEWIRLHLDVEVRFGNSPHEETS